MYVNILPLVRDLVLTIPKGTKNYLDKPSALKPRPVSEYKRTTQVTLGRTGAVHIGFEQGSFCLITSPEYMGLERRPDLPGYRRYVLKLEDVDVSEFFHIGALRSWLAMPRYFDEVWFLANVLKTVPYLRESYLYLVSVASKMDNRLVKVNFHKDCQDFVEYITQEFWDLIGHLHIHKSFFLDLSWFEAGLVERFGEASVRDKLV